MNRTFEIGDKVLVTPWRFNGQKVSALPARKVIDLFANCKTVRGVVVHITGPFGPSQVLYSVKLLEDAGSGWYAGDTCRARRYQINHCPHTENALG